MAQIVGIVETASMADEAIAGLLTAGLGKNDISLLMSDKTKSLFAAAFDNESTKTAQDTAIGAGAGGVLGALLAGLTTAGAVLIPGAQLLLVGPMVAAIAGAGTGAVAGGLIGALTSAGVSIAEASHYEKELKAGKAIIIAHTRNDAQTQAARAVLMSQGAGIRAA